MGLWAFSFDGWRDEHHRSLFPLVSHILLEKTSWFSNQLILLFFFFSFFFFFFFSPQGAKRLLRVTVDAAREVLSSLSIASEVERKARLDRAMYRYQQSMGQLKLVFRELQKIDKENQEVLVKGGAGAQDPKKVEEYERLVAEAKRKNDTLYVLMSRTRELLILVQQVYNCQISVSRE